MIRIECIQPYQYSLWDDYVRQIPQSSVYQMSGWLTSIASTYHLPVHFLTCFENDEIRGILPLVLIDSPMTGRSLISIPFATSGGLYADTPSIENELVNSAIDFAGQHRALLIEFRQTNPLENHPESHLLLDDKFCTYKLPLVEDPDILWRKFNKKVRNQVRNSEKKGFILHRGLEFLNSFYEVFADRMRDLGTPVHSRNWFYNLAENFPQDFEVFTVLDGNITVGGMFTLRHNETFYTLAACSLKSYFRFNPNNFLYWHTIKYACEHDYQSFDFGRSSDGSGTAHFKSQWGAIKYPLYYYSRDVKHPEKQKVSEPGLAANLFIRSWQILPVPLTKMIGPWFRKRIP